jgi:hypothetical protein
MEKYLLKKNKKQSTNTSPLLQKEEILKDTSPPITSTYTSTHISTHTPLLQKEEILKDTSPPHLIEYINSLSEKELKAYHIAKNHLNTSFTLSKAQGFVKWKNSTSTT